MSQIKVLVDRQLCYGHIFGRKIFYFIKNIIVRGQSAK